MPRCTFPRGCLLLRPPPRCRRPRWLGRSHLSSVGLTGTAWGSSWNQEVGSSPASTVAEEAGTGSPSDESASVKMPSVEVPCMLPGPTCTPRIGPDVCQYRKSQGTGEVNLKLTAWQTAAATLTLNGPSARSRSHSSTALRRWCTPAQHVHGQKVRAMQPELPCSVHVCSPDWEQPAAVLHSMTGHTVLAAGLRLLLLSQ